MIQSDTIFLQLAEFNQQQGPAATLDRLIEYLESEKRFHELFEALKMRMRLRLGLPPAQVDRDEHLSEDLELELERHLIDACRRVGEGLLSSGKIREGWMYMRPVGDRAAAARILQAVEVSDDNADEMLEVLLHEGVDIARGYEISLSKMGTCSSITLFETAMTSRSRADQQIAAGILVRHVHRELFENVKHDLARREGKELSESTLESILKLRPDLLRDGTYHLDTTHLASTVRFARVLDDQAELTQALDLAIYGRHLHPQFQYPGEEPFLDLYPASAIFFRALLGQGVDAGVRYFTQKADSVDKQQHGTVAVEVLVDLLSRVGRPEVAIQELARRLTSDDRPLGIAPTMLQLSSRLGDFQSMRQICQQRNDILGFAAALLQPTQLQGKVTSPS